MKNFIALLLFAAAFAAWYFYQMQTKAKTEITEITQNAAVYEQTVGTRRAEFQALVQALDLQKKVQTKQAEVAAIQDKERTLNETLAKRARERSEIIASSRQAIVGQIIPELTLTDGRKLAQVKILKADDSGLSISLPSGVQKLSPAELPADLSQRLHYGR